MISAKMDSTQYIISFIPSSIIYLSYKWHAIGASNIWDRPGVFYILCGDIMWRKNRKHSYITRSNHCMQIYMCIYTRTLLMYHCVSLYFYLNKRVCHIPILVYSRTRYLWHSTANKKCKFCIENSLVFRETHGSIEKGQ